MGGGIQHATRRAFQGEWAYKAGTGLGDWQDIRTHAAGSACANATPTAVHSRATQLEATHPGAVGPAEHTGDFWIPLVSAPHHHHLQLSSLCLVNLSPKTTRIFNDWLRLPSLPSPTTENLRAQTQPCPQRSFCHGTLPHPCREGSPTSTEMALVELSSLLGQAS